MNGLALLLGHLVGDYIVQNDYMASNKAAPHPGPAPEPPWRYGPAPVNRPPWTVAADPRDLPGFRAALEERNAAMEEADRQEADIKRKAEDYAARKAEWDEASSRWHAGHLACTAHCLMYTLAVWAFAWHWMPLWGLAACFALHWPVDRFRLARWWMDNVSGQAAFASGPLAPWSIVVVDNIAHLLVLLGIAWLAGVPF